MNPILAKGGKSFSYTSPNVLSKNSKKVPQFDSVFLNIMQRSDLRKKVRLSFKILTGNGNFYSKTFDQAKAI